MLLYSAYILHANAIREFQTNLFLLSFDHLTLRFYIFQVVLAFTAFFFVRV